MSVGKMHSLSLVWHDRKARHGVERPWPVHDPSPRSMTLVSGVRVV
jgi:hypothetical protein